jgi:hypothetical protein
MATATRPKPKINYRHREEENDTLWLVKYVQSEYPEAIVECDYAASLNLTNSQRIKLMKTRSEDGMPDVRIYYASRGYHGLVIEMKKEGTVIYKKDGTLRKSPYTRKFIRYGKLFIKRGDHNQEQHDTLMKFEKLGYCARYAIGRNHAKELVDRYFDKKQQMF